MVEKRVQSAGKRRRLDNSPSSVQRRHVPPFSRHRVRRRRDTNRHRQPRTNRTVTRLPKKKHKHIRVACQHMELPRQSNGRIPLRTFANQIQIPSSFNAHNRPSSFLHRPSSNRLQPERRPLHCLCFNRILLRRPMASAFRHRLRGFWAKILRDAV